MHKVKKILHLKFQETLQKKKEQSLEKKNLYEKTPQYRFVKYTKLLELSSS